MAALQEAAQDQVSNPSCSSSCVQRSSGRNQPTIYRDFISTNPKMARLVKGVEIGRFHVKSAISQGHHEWFDERRFLQQNSPSRSLSCEGLPLKE